MNLKEKRIAKQQKRDKKNGWYIHS
jgi:hypothetical protein